VLGSRPAIAVEKDKTVGRGPILYSVAALSVLAALTHLWVTPEHFEEWWGYGRFSYAPLSARAHTARSYCAGLADRSSF
jgi:hypothetical protein